MGLLYEGLASQPSSFGFGKPPHPLDIWVAMTSFACRKTGVVKKRTLIDFHSKSCMEFCFQFSNEIHFQSPGSKEPGKYGF